MSRVLNSEEKLAVSMREIQAEETDCAESGEVKEPERYLEEKTEAKVQRTCHVFCSCLQPYTFPQKPRQAGDAGAFLPWHLPSLHLRTGSSFLVPCISDSQENSCARLFWHSY